MKCSTRVLIHRFIIVQEAKAYLATYIYRVYIFDKPVFCKLRDLCIGKMQSAASRLGNRLRNRFYLSLIDFYSLRVFLVLLPRIVIDS